MNSNTNVNEKIGSLLAAFGFTDTTNDNSLKEENTENTENTENKELKEMQEKERKNRQMYKMLNNTIKEAIDNRDTYKISSVEIEKMYSSAKNLNYMYMIIIIFLFIFIVASIYVINGRIPQNTFTNKLNNKITK